MDDLERFWSKVDQTEGCWQWLGGVDGRGYGRFKPQHARNYVIAHRRAYALQGGTLFEGLVIDHLCRNKLCVKVFPPLPDGIPDPRNHIEVVTQRENVLRGLHGRMVTRCPWGHEYTDATTDRRRGRRSCLVCKVFWGRRKRQIEGWFDAGTDAAHACGPVGADA